jgi:hypothetical protein
MLQFDRNSEKQTVDHEPGCRSFDL